jgi:hypothetical protein
MPCSRVSVLLVAPLALAGLASSARELPDGLALTRLGPSWLSTAANDYNLSTDADENMMVFGRSTKGDFADARIWFARRDGRRWSAPQPAPFGDSRWRDSDPWLTPDGRWLYFISNRPAAARAAGRDDLDLWRVCLVDGEFGTPQHLADPSSEGEELGPEVHGNALVFNSTRAGGPAQLALYRAPLIDGRPGKAEALPSPFNDGPAQGDLTLSPDGTIAIFWSIRGESRDPDLFAVRRHAEAWSPAVRLPAPFNGPGMDFTPAFTTDGKRLRWASQRQADAADADPAGNADLYQADSSLLHTALD